MNRAHISQYINGLLEDISKLSNTLCAMNNTAVSYTHLTLPTIRLV